VGTRTGGRSAPTTVNSSVRTREYLTTAIKAIDKAFQDHYARGNYPAAEIDAQKLERLVKVRFGTSARARRLIVKRCSKGVAL